MKKIYSLFSFLFVCNVIFSQTYISLPDSNTRWVNYIHQSGSFFHQYDSYCANGEDTLINSVTYTKIEICGGLNPVEYFGGMRSQLGQVFFFHKDSLNETLLYDFTLNQGDSIWNVYNNFTPAPNPLVVSFVDSVLLNGSQRKRIHIQNGRQWIEGIGNTAGLFQPSLSPLSVSWDLHCMSYDGMSFSGFNGSVQQSTGDCSLTTGVNKSKDRNNSVSIFPNPTTDLLTLNTSEVIQEVLIYGTQGNLIQRESSNSFSVRNLKEGVYILKIQTIKGYNYGRFIKK